MMLDTVHHQGLRLALGAFRTLPVESLYVEAEEPSLYLRREKLSLQYAIRLAANPSNPTFKVTFPPHISQDIIDLYDNKPNSIRSFGLRIAPLLTSANINKEQSETHSVSEIPSWCIRKPTIGLSLHSEKKSESNPHLLKQNFHDLQSYYSDHEHMYTDGSKDGAKVGCADETPFNKLKEIEPIVNHHRLVPKLSRREEIVLARLRIRHTRVTNSCLLKREERPHCVGCDTPFTVRHFLLDCADFGRERRSLFQVNNLKDLFKDVSVENILSFLKNVNLFNKI